MRGNKVEVQVDLQADLAPLVLCNSGRARGVTLRPFIQLGKADPHRRMWCG